MKTVLKLLLLLVAEAIFAQRFQLEQPAQFMQLSNPSYFGLNAKNVLGLAFQSSRVSQQTNHEQQYFFGAFSLPERNFSLAGDFFTTRDNQIGIRQNRIGVNFIYQLQLNNELYLLPSIGARFNSTRIGQSAILLEDQLDQQSGIFTNNSIDPFLRNENISGNHLGVSVGVLLHHQRYIIGFSAARINMPNASLSDQVQLNLPIRLSLQGGFEFDLRPRTSSFFSSDTSLFLSTIISTEGENYELFLGEEFNLDNFHIGLNQQLYYQEAPAISLGANLGFRIQNFDIGGQFSFPLRKINQAWGPKIFQFYTRFDLTDYRYGGDTNKRLNQNNY